MKALVIAGNSFRRFFRDRSTVFFTMILPVIIIFIVGNATSRFDDPEFPVGIVDEGSGPLGAELQRTLEREESISLEAFDEREDVAKLIRRGAIAAGIVVPRAYDSRLRGGEHVRVEFLFDQTRGFPSAVRSIIAGAVGRQGASIQAASFATKHAGRTFDQNLAEARRTAEITSNATIGARSERVGTAGARSYLPPGINYQTPSNLILFVFITSVVGSALLIRSRQLRVTHRMLGTPTTARTILAGEALSRFVTAGYQALFIFVVGTLLFGVSWGPPLAAAAVIALFVAVGTAIGMLFGTIFRTPEQAGAIGAPLGIAAGMLGGCMWPLEIVPAPMRTLGHIFPHAWAMDAWIDLIGRGGGFTDILPELAVLAGFVVVLFPLGAWRLRRAIVAG